MSNSPGWFADPAGSGDLRYFDGSSWTGHVQPAAPLPPAAPRPAGRASEDPRLAPLAEFVAARKGRTIRGLAAVPVVFVVLSLFNSYRTGGLGTSRTWITIVATLLGALAVGAFLMLRRRRIVRSILASTPVPEALWRGGVRRSPPGMPGMGLMQYRKFATGLLAVTPRDVRFVPGPQAVRNGHQPFAVPLAAVLGGASYLAMMDPLGGRYIYLQFGDGTLMEFVGDGRGLAQACGQVGIPFLTT